MSGGAEEQIREDKPDLDPKEPNIMSYTQTLSSKMVKTGAFGIVAYKKDIKEFIKKLKEDFDECRDKTDIWDSERWDKFERLFKKRIIKRAGKELI